MAEILKFPRNPKEGEDDLVWRCNCGCSTHYAHANGYLTCAHCGTVGNGTGGEWRKSLPDEAHEPKEIEEGDIRVTSLDSPHAALKRVQRLADPDDLAALIVMQKDGRLNVWGDNFDTEERVEWLDRRLADARRFLLMEE